MKVVRSFTYFLLLEYTSSTVVVSICSPPTGSPMAPKKLFSSFFGAFLLFVTQKLVSGGTKR